MSASSIWAVVPIKPFAAAKLRLADTLSPPQRVKLARLMAEDVLDALAACNHVLAGTLVVTADPEAAALATQRGAQVLLEPEAAGINRALTCAARHLATDGAGMIVVPADLPHIGVDTIEHLVRLLDAPRAVALMPATDDGGTNVLALRPAAIIAPGFGPQSFERHRQAAQAAGLTPAIFVSAQLGRDIDRPEDLAPFIALRTPTRSHAFLAGLGIGTSELFIATTTIDASIENLALNSRLAPEQALALADCDDLDLLMGAAARRRDNAHGNIVSYSRKVFIPLTKLCRDVCHYCTFAQAPRRDAPAYLSPEQVLEIARAGRDAGCKEALFTLGDKPELRYRAARDELAKLGHATTISYLAEAARLVFKETGLLPHANPGLLTAADLAALRTVSISQGIMLESASARLGERGGPHHGSPDKDPTARLETIRLAGEQGIPFTTGILIGIGETRRERIEALLALRDLDDAYGHIQEIIIQNFRPKPDTRMAGVPPASLHEHLWTIAAARLIFASKTNIQAPPNLSAGALRQLIEAGINDWGGVSPVTPDHVNPEAPWPHLQLLERASNSAGMELVERLAIYPAYARAPTKWADPALRTSLLHLLDADGWPRNDGWSPGIGAPLPSKPAHPPVRSSSSAGLTRIVDKACAGEGIDESEIVRLFRARGAEYTRVCAAADALRAKTCGDEVSYVVTRNINYTNICYFKCQFCAFSKGKMSENLRGRPYDLSLDEIARRVEEAWERGATEVCMQGGIHPDYTGQTYLDICRAVKRAAPGIHIHAFSPLEVHQGAATLGMPVDEFMLALKDAGLGTLPGTAAEILDDEVRAVLCPDKIDTARWLEVMRAAHRAGFRTTSTIMYGHVDRYEHWARHLLRLRNLQAETGGFTELVPLPFVHMEAPIYLKGRARKGPTLREAVLMHAVGRLALHPLIANIQTSWVKMGPDGIKTCLNAGANDLGGTLMDETITRSAGAIHGQEMSPDQMEAAIRSLGRTPRQRTTTYATAPGERVAASLLPRANLRQNHSQI